MDELDILLSMIENPTRRRILEALVREPHYPLQLSKELGVSQQAVMKNLNVLERNGMVVSYRESSSIGPDRTVYEPTSEFTLVVDMRSGMFSVRMMRPEDGDSVDVPREEDLAEARKRISEIDRSIDELDRRRSLLVRERERLIASAMSSLDGTPCGYGHRMVMYEALDGPEMTVEDISNDLRMSREDVAGMVDDIEQSMRMRKDRR